MEVCVIPLFVAGVVSLLVTLLSLVSPIAWIMRRSTAGYWAGRISLSVLAMLVSVFPYGYLYAITYGGLVDYYGLESGRMPRERVFYVELTLRATVPDVFEETCLSGHSTVCDRADAVINDPRWADSGWFIFYAAIIMFPVLVTAGIAWFCTGIDRVARMGKFARPKKKRPSFPEITPAEGELILKLDRQFRPHALREGEVNPQRGERLDQPGDG